MSDTQTPQFLQGTEPGLYHVLSGEPGVRTEASGVDPGSVSVLGTETPPSMNRSLPLVVLPAARYLAWPPLVRLYAAQSGVYFEGQ